MDIGVASGRSVAHQFALDGAVAEVAFYGKGLINDTFIVTTDRGQRAILQRLNSCVFPNPERIQHNLRRLHQHRERMPTEQSRRFCLPDIIQTHDARDYFRQDDAVWRMSRYIGGSVTLRCIDHPAQCYEVGAALGAFHAAFDALDVASLHNPLPGFHCTPRYLEQFEEVMAAPRTDRLGEPDLAAALDFVARRRREIDILERARRAGRLQVRVIHGDPKLDNVLFDDQTGHAMGLIDLDTVMPGLILYDLGDCVRSCCNVAAEDDQDGRSAHFDPDRLIEVLTGYLDEARAVVTQHDWTYLYAAIRLIPFELGLRFLTDHLAGNVYFRVESPGRNLVRAAAQFQLVESIERQAAAIRRIVQSLLPGRRMVGTGRVGYGLG